MASVASRSIFCRLLRRLVEDFVRKTAWRRKSSGQISPSGYTWSSSFKSFQSITLITHSFRPLSQSPAHGTESAVVNEYALAHSSRGRDGRKGNENESTKTSGTGCLADRRSVNRNLRNFQRERPTPLTRLPSCSPQPNQGSAYRSCGRVDWRRTARRKERCIDWRGRRRRNRLLDSETSEPPSPLLSSLLQTPLDTK